MRIMNLRVPELNIIYSTDGLSWFYGIAKG
jgi:hypothetical protein